MRKNSCLFFAALLVFGVSCGTETGNPTSSGTAGISSVVTTAAESIRDTLCAKLVECHGGLTAAACLTGINAATNIDTELGLSSGAYESYSAVIEAERSSEIQAASGPRVNCIGQVEALDCADASIQSAYDSGDPDDFSGVVQMIPVTSGSCPDVYP